MSTEQQENLDAVRRQDHTYSIAHPMYWSNSWAGGVLTATALAGLTAAAWRPGRR